MRLVIIGCGYWGSKIVSAIQEDFDNVSVESVDSSGEARLLIKNKYPTISVYHDINEITNVKSVDGFIIATPTPTHYKLAVKILSLGKPLWLEKPPVTTIDQLTRLKLLAEKRRSIVFVDFTYLYDEGIQKLKKYIYDYLHGDTYQVRCLSYVENGLTREITFYRIANSLPVKEKRVMINIDRQPLSRAIQHFLRCVKEKKEPITNLGMAENILSILNKIELSIKNYHHLA